MTSGVSGTGSDTGTGGIQDGKRQISPEEKAEKEEAELKKIALFQADKNHAEGVLHKMKSPSLWKGVKEAYPDIKDNPTAVANGVAEVAKANGIKDAGKISDKMEVKYPGQLKSSGAMAYGDNYRNLQEDKQKQVEAEQNVALASTAGVNDKQASAKEANNEGYWAYTGAVEDEQQKKVIAEVKASESDMSNEVAKADTTKNATTGDATKMAKIPEVTPSKYQLSFNLEKEE